MEKIKCSICGLEHNKNTSNCCWIECDCGNRICGQCGSTNIGDMDIDECDEEAQYWCFLICNDCGLQGCAMCI